MCNPILTFTGWGGLLACPVTTEVLGLKLTQPRAKIIFSPLNLQLPQRSYSVLYHLKKWHRSKQSGAALGHLWLALRSAISIVLAPLPAYGPTLHMPSPPFQRWKHLFPTLPLFRPDLACGNLLPPLAQWSLGWFLETSAHLCAGLPS